MTSQVAVVLGAVALVAALLALALATLANRRWARRVRHGGPAPVDPALPAAVSALAGEIADLRRTVTELGAALEESGRAARSALRRVAVVRYDAFADVGGRLSYSAAILDDTASGLVITALSGKSDIRTYIKAVSAGTGASPLTPEEQQAVSAAAGSAP